MATKVLYLYIESYGIRYIIYHISFSTIYANYVTLTESTIPKGMLKIFVYMHMLGAELLFMHPAPAE